MMLIIVLYTLMAASFTIAKAVVSYAAPVFFVGVRMTFAGACIIGYLLLARTHRWRLVARKDYFLFAVVTFVHIYATYLLDLLSIGYMTSSKAAFIYNLAPFITVLYSYLHFRERMTSKKWLGLLIGFAGFIPEFVTMTPPEIGHAAVGVFSWPELMMTGSVIFAAYGWIIMRVLMNRGYNALQINGVAMWYGGLLSLLTSFFYDQWWARSPVGAWQPFIGLTLLIILVSNIAAYNLYGYLLHRYTATFISFAGFLCPIIAAILGFVFLSEPLTWRFFFSVLVVSLGLGIFYSQELQQGYVVHDE